LQSCPRQETFLQSFQSLGKLVAFVKVFFKDWNVAFFKDWNVAFSRIASCIWLQVETTGRKYMCGCVDIKDGLSYSIIID